MVLLCRRQVCRALGSAARPLAQPSHVPSLREVEQSENREAEERREADVGANALDEVH